MESVVKQFKALVVDDRLVEAETLLQEHGAELQEACADATTLVQQRLRKARDSREYARGLVQTGDGSVQIDADWTLIKEANGIRTFHKHSENARRLCIRVEGIVNAPLIFALCAVREVDLVGDFVRVVKVSGHVLAMPSKFAIEALFRVALPFPFSDRVIFVDADAVLLDEATVVISGVSPRCRNSTTESDSSANTEVDIPALTRGASEVYVIKAAGVVQRRSSDQVFLSVAVELDTGDMWLPHALVDWTVKHLCYYGFSDFRRRCESLYRVGWP
ncbi:MAG: hypothetical protein MHM6MM_001016 [Cercozoa sp. M6MM]